MKENYIFTNFKRVLLLLVFMLSLTVRSQSCADTYERIYASEQTWSTTLTSLLGATVTNPDLAIDSDINTYSVINTGVSLASLGTTEQTLSWGGNNIAAGTPVSIKLGTNSGLLAVGSAVIIQPMKNGSEVGSSETVTANLLSLISGDSTYEFTFIPEASGTPIDYDAIKVIANAPVGIGFSIKVYEAYYQTPTQTITNCDDILDLFYGIEDLGLEALTATIGVTDPWNAVDNDPTTYAVMHNGAAVLARAQLTAVFSSPMQGSDELEIIVSEPNTLLSIETLSGFTIQRYNGMEAVGTPLAASSSLVSVGFLGSSDSEVAVVVAPNDNLVYDRIVISLGGVAEVLNNLRIHEIKRKAGFQISGVLGNVIYLESGDSNSFTLQDPTNCTTFQVFDEDNNALSMTENTFELPLNLIEGQTYNFYVQGYRYGCPFGVPTQIVVIVGDFSINPEECPEVFNRVYATHETWNTVLFGGTTANSHLAVDGDPSTHSTITVAVGVVGLGTTYQDLSWGGTVIPAGTPVSIKLGPEYGAVGLGTGLSVVGRRNNSNIGVIQGIDGALLSLIPGENVYEYTFIPSKNGIPEDYDEIRISLGGALAVGVSVRIFEAYYHVPTETLANCGTGEILDLFYGVEDLGIGVLTGTVGVADAWDAVDGDDQTYATIYNGASVLAQAHLTAIFSTPSIGTDKLEIKVSKPGELLTVGLLDGFVIQRYYGTNTVGEPLDFSSSLLSLGLLNPGDDEGTIVFAPDDGLPYDRIKISLGGVANVLDGLRVHEITRKPFVKIDNSNNMEVKLCIDDVLSFEQVDDCTIYQVEDENGNVLTANGTYGFDLPNNVIPGNSYTYTVQAVRYGCNFGVAQEISITVLPRAEESDLNDILVNGEDTQTICIQANEQIELTVSLADSSVITNPVFVWYDNDGNAITGGESGTLNLGVLSSGVYTYAVGVYGDNFCESTPTERKEITFTIEHSAKATDIEVDGDGDIICFTDNATLTPTSPTVLNPQFTWYLTNDSSSPIIDGYIDGSIIYSVSASGVLTIEGLLPGTTITYFVTVSGDGVCENMPGDFAQATLNVHNVPTPTTTQTTQEFCLVQQPTFSDIQTNETGVVWYDTPTGGTPYAENEALVSGTYYGAILSNEGCESTTRLEVVINVEDVPTPTTTQTTQEFCLAQQPTFSDIQTNETGVVWYDTPTGGTPYAENEALVSGTYYGAILSNEGCESTTRLEVVINVEDVPTPTTAQSTQKFCLAQQPTFSGIQTNEIGVIWYDAPTGGTPYAETDELVSGTYYGAILSNEGCESTTRLEVVINVEDVPTPTTTQTTQEFCLAQQPTFSDIQTNETGVVWYDTPTGGTPYAENEALVSGTYYGAILSNEGCESTTRLEVVIILNEGGEPTIESDSSGEICLHEIVTYTIEAGHTNYNWEIIGGEIVSGGTVQDNFVSVRWTSAGNALITLSYEPSNECYSHNTVMLDQEVIVCADITIHKEVDNLTPMIGEEVTFTVTVTNSGPNDFESVVVSEMLQSGFSYVSSHTTIGAYSPVSGLWNIEILPANQTATLTVIAKVLDNGDYTNIATIISSEPGDLDTGNNSSEIVLEPICLFVFNEFSPNDDGMNDYFIITCIEDYPNNELKVFNKYGSLVYKHKGYNNTWNGVANAGGIPNSGEVLPSDTYYYVLDIGDGRKPKTGWIFIIR